MIVVHHSPALSNPTLSNRCRDLKNEKRKRVCNTVFELALGTDVQLMLMLQVLRFLRDSIPLNIPTQLGSVL